MTQDQSRKGIKSVETSSKILFTLAENQSPMRLKALSEALGIPPAQVHNYLVSLCRSGLVEQRGKSGRYKLGPAMLKFGLAALSQNRFHVVVEDAVDDLFDDIGLTVVMAVWSASGPVIVRWRHGLETLSVNTGLGSTLPLLTTAIGRAFLAHSPDEITRKLLDEEKQALARSPFFKSLADEAAIQQINSETRENGFASISGILSPSMMAFAVPVFQDEDSVFAAVAIIEENGDPKSAATKQHLRKLKNLSNIILEQDR